MAGKNYYCNYCKNSTSTPLMKSNGFIEIGLYFLYIVPGIIHSIWRRTGEKSKCPFCKKDSLVLEIYANKENKKHSLMYLKEAKILLKDKTITQKEFDKIKLNVLKE